MKKLGEKIKNSKAAKVILIILAIVLIAAVVVFVLWKKGVLFSSSDGEEIYVESVASVVSSSVGESSKYLGVIESQSTQEVKIESGKTVSEVLVSEGDTVKAGDVLFKYSTDEFKEQIDSANLEVQNNEATIAAYQQQIAELEAERERVEDSAKFEYTTQIQSIQLEITSAQASLNSAKQELANIQAEVSKAVEKSKIDGVVKQISNNNETDGAFMVIQAEGDYTVKGTVSEENVASLAADQEVLVRSRVDDKTWKGVITKVDTDNTVESNQDEDYSVNTAETSAKYNFYVTLESPEGVMLGQHVYIDTNTSEKVKEGIWLSSAYVVTDDGKTGYVWTRSSSNRLKKQQVTLGDYDEETDEYKISKGLAIDDYICAAMDELTEGMKTIDPTASEAEDSESDDEEIDDVTNDSESVDLDQIDTDTSSDDSSDSDESGTTETSEDVSE